MPRTTTQVLHDHLMKRMEGDLEGDIRDNFHEDVVLLSSFATYRGHEGIRQSSEQLWQAIGPAGSFSYSRTVIEGEYAFLEWTAEDDNTCVHDGVDSYHIVDGRVAMQTVHFTARPRG